MVNDGECDGDKRNTLFCLSNQLKKNTNKSRFPKACTEIEDILYPADIANELNIDLEKTFICLHHLNQLFAQFDPIKHKRCYICASISGQTPATTKQHRQISRKLAVRIYSSFKVKHSYGEFICRTCRKGFDDFLHNYRMKKISKIIEQGLVNRAIQQYTSTDAQMIEEDDNDTDQIPSEEDSSSDVDTGDDFIPDNDRESTKLPHEALDHLLSLYGNRNRT